MSLGHYIRQKRKSLNLTLQQLAAKINADAGNLSRIERGELGISESLLRKISSALETTPANIYALSESNSALTVEEPRQANLSQLPVKTSTMDFAQQNFIEKWNTEFANKRSRYISSISLTNTRTDIHIKKALS